jgi:hypothetical protein
VIDAVTTLGKVDVLNAATLSVAITSLSLKLLDIAGFHLVADGLVDNPDTYIENSDSVMAKPLNIL